MLQICNEDRVIHWFFEKVPNGNISRLSHLFAARILFNEIER